MNLSFIFFVAIVGRSLTLNAIDTCANITEINLDNFSKFVIPSLAGDKKKGDNGQILIIGGSEDYVLNAGPYFAAIAAVRAGADLVTLLTTETTATVMQLDSRNFLVYPLLNIKHEKSIQSLISTRDIIVLGSGTFPVQDIKLYSRIIQICKDLKKPLIIDAGALTILSKNASILVNYSSPGVILTPNLSEVKDVIDNGKDFGYWGKNVSVLLKGETDEFYSNSMLTWRVSDGGSGRRTPCQGDILAGFLGTFLDWTLKANICNASVHFRHSFASYAAAKLMRACNARAFAKHGRSMASSDIIPEIHYAFMELFKRV